jgi:phage tail sheath protein FI
MAKALGELAKIDEIALVAAPGQKDKDVQQKLISHCESNDGIFYRFAILDGPDTSTDLQPDTMGKPDNTNYAAWYFPWITVFDPIRRRRNRKAMAYSPSRRAVI